MDDPKLAQNGRPPENEAQLREFNKKKGHGGAGIFITVVCLAIAAACLVPLFLGGSLFGGDEDKSTSAANRHEPVIIPVNNTGDAFKQDQATNDPLQNAGITREDIKRAQNDEAREPFNNATTQDPLAPPQSNDQYSSRQDPNAVSTDHGNASVAKQDDGGLLPNLEDGIEADTPKSNTKNSVTLKGETLEAIEKSEAGSGKDTGLPRRSLDGSLNKTEDEAKTADDEFITRADNVLHADEIKAEDEALKKQQELEVQAAKQDALPSQSIQAGSDDARLKALADHAASALDDKTTAKSTAKVSPRKTQGNRRSFASYDGVPTGNAIPGASSELLNKDPNHYALQVIAGRNRAAVVRASGALSGRYWIYETSRERRPWYVLVTGDYASPNEALRQGRRLPASLRTGRPFAKTFDRIQSEMRLSATNGQP